MNPDTVAKHINRLPWETWLDADASADLIGLPAEETGKLLRAGRRRGSITVCRENGVLKYKRVRLHPLPSRRLQVAMS
jgi:hypothetical protein